MKQRQPQSALVEAVFEAPKCLKNSVCEASKLVTTKTLLVNLVDVSDIFYFFCLGEGKGEVRGAGRGRGTILIKNSRRGVSRGRGGEGPGACLRGIWGGGGVNFFRGRNSHQAKQHYRHQGKAMQNLMQLRRRLLSFWLVVSRSLQDSARVIISWLLARNCCALAVVVS